jgi:hypothetical protein
METNRLRGRSVHNIPTLHSDLVGDGQSSTRNSQPLAGVLLHQQSFIHNFHRTYYCCFYISVVSSQKKLPGDTASGSARGGSSTGIVTPID